MRWTRAAAYTVLVLAGPTMAATADELRPPIHVMAGGGKSDIAPDGDAAHPFSAIPGGTRHPSSAISTATDAATSLWENTTRDASGFIATWGPTASRGSTSRPGLRPGLTWGACRPGDASDSLHSWWISTATGGRTSSPD